MKKNLLCVLGGNFTPPPPPPAVLAVKGLGGTDGFGERAPLFNKKRVDSPTAGVGELLVSAVVVASALTFASCGGVAALDKEYEETITVEDGDVGDALDKIKKNAQDGSAYIIELKADASLPPQILYFDGKKVSITIRGAEKERTISLASRGSLFTVKNGVTLTLDKNLKLQGLKGANNNNAALISLDGAATADVPAAAAMVMKEGSTITGNTHYNTDYSAIARGGGVYIGSGASFTMKGGTISGNSVITIQHGSLSHGGGVYIGSGASFTMKDGTISGNKVEADWTGGVARGGGVQVSSDSTFNLEGGIISGNTGKAFTVLGGGMVKHENATFNHTGGVIYGSDAAENLRNKVTIREFGGGDAVSWGYNNRTYTNTTVRPPIDK